MALLGVGALLAQRHFQVKGIVYQGDSNDVASFAYVINNNSHNGVVTDMYGKFVIAADENDSLSIQVLGFEKLVIYVNKLANENDSVKAFKKFRLKVTTYNLASVYVNAFKIKPNERAYMNRIINRPTVKGIDVVSSPITAIWQRFSKRGRELEKLEKIFEGVFRQEAIDNKINTESLRKLVGDEHVTIEQFRIACPEITDEFILYADGYELYSAIAISYKNWKKKLKKGK